MKDNRDPLEMAKAMDALRKVHPEMSACQRADILDLAYRAGLPATPQPQIYNAYAIGNGNHAHSNPDN